MPPIYRWIRKGKPRALHSVVDRLEKELKTLEADGVIVEQTVPDVAVAGRAPRDEFVTISGAGTMRNGLSFTYVHKLRVRRRRTGQAVVLDEFRSYGSVVAGEAVLIRYDSGHEDHKQYPHLDAPWCKAHDVEPPHVDIGREMEFYGFLTAVDEWRADNAWRLAPDPPHLDQVRRRP